MKAYIKITFLKKWLFREHSCFTNTSCFFQGVAPTAQRAAVVVGVELPAYDVVKRYFINQGMGDTKANHFL